MDKYLNLRKCRIAQKNGVILNPYCESKLHELESAKNETYNELQAMLDQANHDYYLTSHDWKNANTVIATALISRIALGYADSLDEASRLVPIDQRKLELEQPVYLLRPQTIDKLTQIANGHADQVVNFMKTTTNEGITRIKKAAKDQNLSHAATYQALAESHLFSKARVDNALDFEATHIYYKGVHAGLKETRQAWKKTWFVSSEHDKDDECDDAEEEGPIDIDQDFGIGVASPPAHINCNCVMSVTLHNV